MYFHDFICPENTVKRAISFVFVIKEQNIYLWTAEFTNANNQACHIKNKKTQVFKKKLNSGALSDLDPCDHL